MAELIPRGLILLESIEYHVEWPSGDLVVDAVSKIDLDFVKESLSKLTAEEKEAKRIAKLSRKEWEERRGIRRWRRGPREDGRRPQPQDSEEEDDDDDEGEEEEEVDEIDVEEGDEGEQEASVEPEEVFDPDGDDGGHGGADVGVDGVGVADVLVAVGHPDDESVGAEGDVIDEVHDVGEAAACEDAVIDGMGIAPDPMPAPALHPVVPPLPELRGDTVFKHLGVPIGNIRILYDNYGNASQAVTCKFNGIKKRTTHNKEPSLQGTLEWLSIATSVSADEHSKLYWKMCVPSKYWPKGYAPL